MTLYPNPALFTLQEMQTIAPSSALLQTDFSGFDSYTGYYYFKMNSTGSGGLMAEFVPWSKAKKDRQWASSIRAGFQFATFQLNGQTYYKRSAFRYDPVVSNNVTFYFDSTQIENYYFSWGGDLFSADVSQLFHTDEKRIFSAGIGYGIQAGIAFNTFFNANHVSSAGITMSSVSVSGGGLYDISGTSAVESEQIKTGAAFYGRAYIPLCLQLRLSRKENVWNKIAFTTEVRTGFDFQSMPNLGMRVNPFFFQTTGFKYYFFNSATK